MARCKTICNLSNAVLLVAQTDVVSLWSAAGCKPSYRKSGTRSPANGAQPLQEDSRFHDEDVEKATNCKVLWKVPNNFPLIRTGHRQGQPRGEQGNNELGRSYQGLAAELAGATTSAEGNLSLLYQHDKGDGKKRTPGHLVVSPCAWTVDPFDASNLGEHFQPMAPVLRGFSPRNFPVFVRIIRFANDFNSCHKKRVLSGMRPTGKLHLGNYVGALQNWVRMQEQYDCFFVIVDWHALTTDYGDTSRLKENLVDVLLDWLAAGLDPEKCVMFIQSHVPAHAELHLLLSMITPLGWLERVPTYKSRKKTSRKKT